MASTSVSPETLATDLRDVLRGHVEDEKIEAAATKLPSLAPCYPAHGNFSRPPEIVIVVDGGKTFRGDAGNVAGSDGPGQVCTGDLDALYANTVMFVMNTTLGYTLVTFFDDQSNLLGYFRAVPLFPVQEIAGGKGHWS